jgi:hypothetical protein
MSVPVALRARGAAASVLGHVPTPGPRTLADPPAGSALRPVMGEPGLPFLGQTFPMFVDSLAFCRSAYRRFG